MFEGKIAKFALVVLVVIAAISMVVGTIRGDQDQTIAIATLGLLTLLALPYMLYRVLGPILKLIGQFDWIKKLVENKDPLALMIWGGDKKYASPEARSTKNVFTIQLFGLFILDMVAWSMMWIAVFRSGALIVVAILLALVCATIQLFFERMIAIANTDPTLLKKKGYNKFRQWAPIVYGLFALRVVGLVAAVMILHDPLERMMFEREIMQQITKTHNESIANVRDRAIADVRAKYGTATSSAGIVVAEMKARQDSLAQLEAARRGQSDRIRAEIDTHTRDAHRQLRGGGRSAGVVGPGRNYRASIAQVQRLEARLDAYNGETERLVREHQEETRRLIAEKRGGLEAEIAKINAMPKEQLVDEYGKGEVAKLDYGILAQQQALDIMEAEDTKAGHDYIKNGRRRATWILLFLAGVVLFTKIAAGERWKNYLSVVAQARRGNPEALAEMRAMGMGTDATSLASLGMSDDEKETLQEIHDLHATLDAEVTTLFKTCRDELDAVLKAHQDENPYLLLTLLGDRLALHTKWGNKIKPVLRDLNAKEREMQLMLMGVPSWPDDLPTLRQDPRLLEKEPWNLSVSEFEAFFRSGHPFMRLLEARDAYAEAEEQIRLLESSLLEREDLIRKNAKYSFVTDQQIREEVVDFYNQQIAPIMWELERLRQVLERQFYFALPPIPGHMPGLDGIQDQYRTVGDDEIKQSRPPEYFTLVDLKLPDFEEELFADDDFKMVTPVVEDGDETIIVEASGNGASRLPN